MDHLLASILAAVILPASANVEPVPTSTSLSASLTVPPVELNASELGLGTTTSSIEAADAARLPGGLSAIGPSATPDMATADVRLPLRTVVTIESDRGVHLIETNPVVRR